MRSTIFALAISMLSSLAGAQNAVVAPPQGDGASRDGVWLSLARFPDQTLAGEAWIRPNAYHATALDVEGMRRVLAAAPMEDTPDAQTAPIVIYLPVPEGGYHRFLVYETRMMTPDFAQARPDIKTYAGNGVEDPLATVHLDLTPQGFHAQVLSPGKSYWIDPFTRDDTTHYSSYRKKDLPNTSRWRCEAHGEPVPVVANPFTPRAIVTRREYRTAITATGEYTAFHGGTAALAQAATVTSVNRVNQVFERDFAVRLVMINNLPICYTNAATDPFSGTSPSAMLNQNQTNTDAVIGSANYDIGHIYSAASGGGVAQLGSVCGTSKARGVSTFPSPVNDPFNIDYVAHEMGHQFNASHTFAGCGGGSGGNSFEPGSGSTIMAYAGICGSDNLQSNSDPYFHHTSIQAVNTFITSGAGNTCDIPVVTTNNTPTVSHPTISYTIPPSTPFFLTATGGGDVDGDTVTYVWEQRNSAAAALGTTDTGTNPLFRPRVPTTSPTQSFPAFDDVLDGTLDPGDIWPTTNRTLAFRVTARDNRAGNGGVTIPAANYNVTVNTTGGAFSVTAPNTNVLITTPTTTVTWNAGSTAAAPFNTANVQILLSTDGGATFPTVLAASTPNDGSETVSLPAVTSNTCRIMVQAVGNIFYDVSNVNFRLQVTGAPPNPPTNVTATPNPACPGQSVSLSATVNAGETVYWYTTACGTGFVSTANPFVTNFISTSTYYARARRNSDSVFSTTCTPVTITVDPNPVAPTSASVDQPSVCAGVGTISLTATGGSGTTLRWFADACGGASVGTGSPLVIPAPSVATTYHARWETVCGNSSCASVSVAVTPLPSAPTATAATPAAVCPSTGTISLSATGGSGDTLRWYVGDCTGTSIGTGTPLVIPAPSVATTYVARWENACGVSACSPGATVTVSPLPVAPSSASVDRPTVCAGDGNITLTATGGSGDTLRWFNDVCGYTSIGTGSPLVIPAPSLSTTYFARWENACGNSACVSVAVAVTSVDIDFNNDDVSPDVLDIEDFLSVFGGGACSNDPNCDSIDFNGDGVSPDVEDVVAFLAAFGGGGC